MTTSTHSRWLWGIRLRKHNVKAPSWRSMTTGMRGGDEGIPEGRGDAEANECPKAICELAIRNFGGNIQIKVYR